MNNALSSFLSFRWISDYTHWLHTKWPAGKIEKLPDVQPDGSTKVAGLYVVGDLTGIPLLKFSSDTGARVIRTIVNDPSFERGSGENDLIDVAIIGAGVSGLAAAIEARNQGLSYRVYEAQQPFSTIANFPKGKPIYTYPTDMTPAGDVQFRAEVKEDLLAELEDYRSRHGVEITEDRIQNVRRRSGILECISAGGEPVCAARRVVVAIGRSGNFRKLGVPGEDKDKVFNRLHDPREFCGKQVLVVGGGDSAMEAATALGACGADVILSYRKKEFSRPKPENVQKLKQLSENPEMETGVESPTSERITTAADSSMRGDAPAGSVRLEMASSVREIREEAVVLSKADGSEETVPNDAVFLMIGREAPLEFFRRSGVPIRGERNAPFWSSFAAVVLLSSFVYHWKKPGTFLPLAEWLQSLNFFPFGLGDWWKSLGEAFSNPTTLPGTLSYVVDDPGFYYSLLYCSVMLIFGIRRIRRRRTPYVKWQTVTLISVQLIPLFLLPYLLLPWAGFNGWFDEGIWKAIADSLFPEVNYGSGREYWRAFGLILAWPLFIWNLFTEQPLWGWLAISMIQTFVDYSVDYLAVGQRGILRLDLLLRRHGGNPG